MKRILTGVLATLLSAAAMAATLNPIQLLNPAGSTSGQVITSTGASTPPAWANVTVSGLGAVAANTVLANATGSTATPTAFAMPSCSGASNALRWTSGTGFTCASGIALLTGSTFTGSVAISPASGDGTLTVNAVNANTADLYLQTGGVTMWGIVRNNATNSGSNAGSNFQITRYTDAGASIDNPFVITRSTGTVTMSDGITSSPISGSTGSFTTLAASSTVSGTGFSTYLASPPAIGGTAAAAGSFTTLAASSNSAVFSTNTSAQSIPNGAFTTVTGWTAVTDRNSNWTASTGTFTAPRAGMYMVSAALATAAVSWGANNNLSIAVFKNGTEVAQATKIIDAANGATTQGVALPAVVISCAASDALTIRVFQSQGAAVALGSTAVANWVSIAQIP